MKDNFFKKIKKQKGYALLFAIIIIGSISAVVSGLLSSTAKQLVLSSLAQDSLTAFYQADIAMDCAFYAELNGNAGALILGESTEWACGEQILVKIGGEGTNVSYGFVARDNVSPDPCFEINVVKSGVSVEISAKGYNICNKLNPRTVEREITASYEVEN